MTAPPLVFVVFRSVARSSGSKGALYAAAVPANALAAVPPNPFRTYYQRLRGRGMSGSVAIGHLAGKLISVLYFCLRSGQPYDPIRHARDLGLGDACSELEV